MRKGLARLTAQILLVCALAVVGISDAQARRVALIVGNSAYEHTAPLTNPKNDADDLAAALSVLGFEVIKGIDLKKAEMEKTIRHFADSLVGADLGLFFYAGHGLQVSGENYLVPIDAQLSTASALDFEMIRLSLIQRAMEAETKTNIILLDACRDNPLSRNLARALGTRSSSIEKGLAQFEAGLGTLISFSTQPGNVALDGTGRNSPYTAALVKHIATPSESLISVLIRVRNEVIAETASRQIPWDQHALRQQIFLGGNQPVAAQKTNEVASDAASAWGATKDTTSIAVLEALAKRYRSTVYADLAEARIKELRALGKGQERPQKPVTLAARSHAPAPNQAAASCSNIDGMKVCASSVLKSAGANTSHYGPRNLLDGTSRTAWVEGVGGNGIGEWVVISWGPKLKVRGFRIANGYGKSDSLFERNASVSQLSVSFSNGAQTTLQLRNTPDRQDYDLAQPLEATWVRLEIQNVRKGTKYPDTAISELRPIFQ